jgi:hypothetical protein
MSTAWNLVLMPITFYTFGVILWFIPYTVLAIGMLIWSRNKPTAALSKLAMLAPILFLALMLIEAVLVSLPAESIAKLTKDLPGQSALLGGFSLLFGYLCVGVAMGLYKFMQSKNLIKQDNEPSLSET